VVRHHAWRDHWFTINCTTDLRGRRIETTAPDDVPPFAFNCSLTSSTATRSSTSWPILHPFVPTDAPEAPAMDHVELSQADLLRPGSRASW
jgi:hypothetical protein